MSKLADELTALTKVVPRQAPEQEYTPPSDEVLALLRKAAASGEHQIELTHDLLTTSNVRWLVREGLTVWNPRTPTALVKVKWPRR